MHDWNVVATARERQFTRARLILSRLGKVDHTNYFNVLVMKADEPRGFLQTLADWLSDHPEDCNVFGYIAPCTRAFQFRSPQEFNDKLFPAAREFVPSLAHKDFHVRMHRRGFKGQLHSQDEEQLLDEFLLGELERAGTPGKITFDDPDAILAVETIDTQAGLALWTREELSQFPFLHLD